MNSEQADQEIPDTLTRFCSYTTILHGAPNITEDFFSPDSNLSRLIFNLEILVLLQAKNYLQLTGDNEVGRLLKMVHIEGESTLRLADVLASEPILMYASLPNHQLQALGALLITQFNNGTLEFEIAIKVIYATISERLKHTFTDVNEKSITEMAGIKSPFTVVDNLRTDKVTLPDNLNRLNDLDHIDKIQLLKEVIVILITSCSVVQRDQIEAPLLRRALSGGYTTITNEARFLAEEPVMLYSHLEFLQLVAIARLLSHLIDIGENGLISSIRVVNAVIAERMRVEAF